MQDNLQDQPATKAELQSVKVELKADVQKLSDTVTRLAIDLSKTKEDIREIKETMATKGDINRIMTAIDAFAAQALSYQNHDKLRGGKIMEHETKIGNHESRLVLLETHK